MKAITPIKILTLTLFVTLISGFTLYKGGYIFHEENEADYFSDPNGGTGIKVKSSAKEKYGLNTFQKLKMAHVFDPESFDTMYHDPVIYSDNHFLSSSKSALISDRVHIKHSFGLTDSFLSVLLDQQFDTIQLPKRR